MDEMFQFAEVVRRINSEGNRSQYRNITSGLTRRTSSLPGMQWNKDHDTLEEMELHNNVTVWAVFFCSDRV